MSWKREAQIAVGKLCYPVVKRWPRSPSTRRVLLVCNNALMIDYLQRFASLFRGDPRIAFSVDPPNYRLEPAGTKERLERELPFPVTRFPPALFQPWDLIVAADHACNWLVDEARYESIYIDHGIPSGKLVRGEEYAFGPAALDRERGERVRYSRLFTTSHYIAERGERQTADCAGRIGVVGSLENDLFLELAKEREAHRHRLGIGPSDRSILVLSTWGPDSMFQRMGDEVLELVARHASRFKFLIDIHPHEYRPNPDGSRVWGAYLRERSGADFALRDPSESWMPYMAAADLILTDHTTLALQCLPLGTPILQIPYPGDATAFVEVDSAMWKLHEVCPTLHPNASGMIQQIEQAMVDDSLRRALLELAPLVNSYPGVAAQRTRREVYSLLGIDEPS